MKIKLMLAALAGTTAIAFSFPVGAQTNSQGTSQPAVTSGQAPAPGANSFTEEQAKSRIEEAGYANVTGLSKDDQGIWRGQATKDGQQVAIALDYQGNVVAGSK